MHLVNKGFLFTLLSLLVVNSSFAFIAGVPEPGRLISSSCTGVGSNAICTLAGFNTWLDSPLLVQSQDGGKHWKTIIPENANSKFLGAFTHTSCSGESNSAMCTAVGYQKSGKGSEITLPLIYQTRDGGEHWNQVTLPKRVLGGFRVSHCSGKGKEAFCLAGGYSSANLAPILAQTRNGGETWEMLPAKFFPREGEFTAIDCVGNTNMWCYVGGVDLINDTVLLLMTKDKGSTWQRIKTELPQNSILYGISCFGKEANQRCTFIGRSEEQAFILSMDERGSLQSSYQPRKGVTFFDLKCIDRGQNGSCLAVGGIIENEAWKPYLIQSDDGGRTWSEKTIVTSKPLKDFFTAASCSAVFAKVVCTIAGAKTQDGQPVIVQTTDNIWFAKVISDHKLGQLFTTTCIKGFGNRICFAAGNYLANDDYFPWLTQTYDGGYFWESPVIYNLPTKVS